MNQAQRLIILEQMAEVFRTERLLIRTAVTDDAPMYFALWTDPAVMENVGFPQGIPITLQEIEDMLRKQVGRPVYGRNLVVSLQVSATSIGECKMIAPDKEGIARTDIKLLPRYWRKGYGLEVKQGLVSYIFKHSESAAVEATPNIQNLPSIRMQEAVGGVRLGEAVYNFPDSMADFTRPVHHFIYRLYRSEWERRNDILAGDP